MSNVSIWSGVGVSVQSALASAKTITAITKASPGIASSVAHGYTAGDFVTLSIQGMSQLDGRVFRVTVPSVDTFGLEGEDTTLYDIFSSGTAQKITFGTSMSTLTGLTASGGDFAFIDTTTIHNTVKTQIPGAANAGTYSFVSQWDVADAGLIAMKAASDNKATRAVKFLFSNGQKVVFNGYVGCSLLPGGQAQGMVDTPVVVTMFGRPTALAT